VNASLTSGKEETTDPSSTARLSRWLGATVAVALAAAVLAPAAAAHSVLIATEPGNDRVVEESPQQVLLRFNEPVETALGDLRVYDGNGDRVDDGQVTQPRPEEVAVTISDRLPRGTYTVAWHAISADSDPISGAFVFHVQAPGPQPAGVAAEVLRGTPALVSVFYTGGRFFDFALLLLCVGGTAALAIALPWAARKLRRRLWGLLAGLAGALAFVALLALPFQGAAAGDLGLQEAFSLDVIDAVAGTRYGTVMLIQAGLALALGAVALALSRGSWEHRRELTAAALVLAAGLTVTPSASGHASTSGAVAFVADVAHVVAAAVWTGGLGFVVLAILLAGENRWRLASHCVPRFSTMAVVSVATLLVAGIVNGYLQVRTWSALWETTYGLLLLAKIGLVLPLLALGAFNNRYAVPSLRGGIASLVERRRFLRAAGAELALMVAIVAVTAVLVNAEPARTQLEMHAASEEIVVELGDVRAHVLVDPGTSGTNAIRLEFEVHEGDAPELEEVKVSASLPSKELGPLVYTAEPDAAAHGAYVIPNAQLPIPGDWQFRIEARVGEFDLLTETVSVPIREES
jgi:copper transport protein